VVNSYSVGEVSGVRSVGGVVGHLTDGSVVGSYSGATVSGEESVGGVAGHLNSGSRVFSSYFAGTVSGTESVGGVAGSVSGGRVISSAALNSAVKGTDRDVGRIAGFTIGPVTLSNNAAYTGVTNNAGNTSWPNKGASSKDGEDITSRDIHADGTLGERFTAENGWITENGRLPALSGE
jgi:hypothetical protein